MRSSLNRGGLNDPNWGNLFFFFFFLWYTAVDQGGVQALPLYSVGLTELGCYSLVIGQVPEMAARPYSGSFSTSDATNGQSPVPPPPHIPSCPTGPLIAPPKLWQICGLDGATMTSQSRIRKAIKRPDNISVSYHLLRKYTFTHTHCYYHGGNNSDIILLCQVERYVGFTLR
jgi:hypothetical protein